jgi:hypothetical protein
VQSRSLLSIITCACYQTPQSLLALAIKHLTHLYIHFFFPHLYLTLPYQVDGSALSFALLDGSDIQAGSAMVTVKGESASYRNDDDDDDDNDGNVDDDDDGDDMVTLRPLGAASDRSSNYVDNPLFDNDSGDGGNNPNSNDNDYSVNNSQTSSSTPPAPSSPRNVRFDVDDATDTAAAAAAAADTAGTAAGGTEGKESGGSGAGVERDTTEADAANAEAALDAVRARESAAAAAVATEQAVVEAAAADAAAAAAEASEAATAEQKATNAASAEAAAAAAAKSKRASVTRRNISSGLAALLEKVGSITLAFTNHYFHSLANAHSLVFLPFFLSSLPYLTLPGTRAGGRGGESGERAISARGTEERNGRGRDGA